MGDPMAMMSIIKKPNSMSIKGNGTESIDIAHQVEEEKTNGLRLQEAPTREVEEEVDSEPDNLFKIPKKRKEKTAVETAQVQETMTIAMSSDDDEDNDQQIEAAKQRDLAERRR